MQGLLPTTQRILAELEDASGRGFEYLADPSLPVLATIVTARNGAPYHILRYKPSNEPLDYLVGYQAGFIIRMFANPPDRRFDFAPTSAGLPALRSLLTAGIKLNSAELEALPQFEQATHHWSLMNLRSLPIGMRIDEWLYREKPELRALVATGIASQQQVNTNVLAQRFGKLAIPSHLLAANAAYALFAERLLGEGAFSVPYAAVGALPKGRELLAIWDSIPSDPRQDSRLVDSWADALGMTGWYRWIPYCP